MRPSRSKPIGYEGALTIEAFRKGQAAETLLGPTTQVEAVPALHRAEAIEPRLSFRLPNVRLEAQSLELRGAV